MDEALQILQTDLDRADHQQAVLDLTADYALDVMGNGGPLSQNVLDRLVEGLKNHPTTRIFLAYFQQRPVGIATCFLGFSTFAGRPLLNIHDFSVLPEFQGRGIGGRLLAHVEQRARDFGCCKVTLEVQAGNARARAVYQRGGFAQASAGDVHGGSLFFAKPI